MLPFFFKKSNEIKWLQNINRVWCNSPVMTVCMVFWWHAEKWKNEKSARHHILTTSGYILDACSHYLSFICFHDERSACDMCACTCACTICVRFSASVRVYILGTHYQENQCMTLVYSGRLLISLRPHSTLSHFRLSTDTKTYEHRQKHTNQYSVYTEGTIILMSMIKHSW